jgi:Predicted glycosyltransferases
MLNVSIVLYKHPLKEIALLVGMLRKSKLVSEVFLVDNSPTELLELRYLDAIYIFNGKNIGYGAAHNIAIRQTLQQNIPYHLIINPDIVFDSSILGKIVEFMNNNSIVGLLMPKVYYPDGEIQYLCKLLPTPFDLIFRRFLPQNWTMKRTEKFELRASGYNRTIDVPYLSGCFMFLRTEAIQQVGMFDERFFMYPEDIDLTRRIHRNYRTVFYPDVSVLHQHIRGSYADIRLLFIHIKNMIKYFNKWGWFFDNERRNVNKDTLKQLE